MKRITALLLGALLLFSLVSCGGKEEKKSKPKEIKKDWRNSIEYEGSFFVNAQKKILYALDTGKVTLWDNAGDGTPLQTLKYDTAVSDAMSKVETEDFNNDGDSDIRIIYSETDGKCTYNLWLWNDMEGCFLPCSLYRTVVNPVYNEADKTLIGDDDMGIFGNLRKTFVFEEDGTLTNVSADITNADEVAGKISEKFAKGELRLGEGHANVENAECNVFIVSEGGEDSCYIAYNGDADWFIDIGCTDVYRAIYEENGDFALGDYVGEAKNAVNIVNEYSGFDDAVPTARKTGKLLGYDAERFEVCADGGNYECTVIITEKKVWYLEDESGICFPLYASSQSLGEAVDGKFGN